MTWSGYKKNTPFTGEPAPHPVQSPTYGLVFNSIVATNNGFLTLGGSYDNIHDIKDIYQLDCQGDVTKCSAAKWELLESGATLLTARSGKVAILMPDEYLSCDETN